MTFILTGVKVKLGARVTGTETLERKFSGILSTMHGTYREQVTRVVSKAPVHVLWGCRMWVGTWEIESEISWNLKRWRLCPVSCPHPAEVDGKWAAQMRKSKAAFTQKSDSPRRKQAICSGRTSTTSNLFPRERTSLFLACLSAHRPHLPEDQPVPLALGLKEGGKGVPLWAIKPGDAVSRWLLQWSLLEIFFHCQVAMLPEKQFHQAKDLRCQTLTGCSLLHTRPSFLGGWHQKRKHCLESWEPLNFS